MSRQSEFEQKKVSPVTKYLEWNSGEKCLSYYDKVAGGNILVQVPTQFIILKQMSSLTGWSDTYNCGLYSTEADYFGGEEVLTLATMKKGADNKPLFSQKGNYKTLKGVEGSKFKKNVYAVLDGELVCIQLKGCALTNFLGYQKNADGSKSTPNPDAERSRFLTEYVSIVGSIAAKKGSTKFNVPIYEFSGTITAEDNKLADELYDALNAFKEDASQRGEVDENAIATEEKAIADEIAKEESDDTPF